MSLDLFDLTGKVAIITGASRGLGQYLTRALARAGADVVIVFPHWGVEYTRQPLASMRKHAARWVDAGADLVLGAHSHVAGSIEDIDGAPVLYSLGNLIFDQHWSTNTMESALLEATFHDDQLIELRLRPYIIHDTSQPNFLDPGKGEGRRLLLSMNAIEERHRVGDRKTYYRLRSGWWVQAATTKMAGFERLADEARRIRAAGSVTRSDGLDELIDFSEFWSEEIPKLRDRWERRRQARERET